MKPEKSREHGVRGFLSWSLVVVGALFVLAPGVFEQVVKVRELWRYQVSTPLYVALRLWGAGLGLSLIALGTISITRKRDWAMNLGLLILSAGAILLVDRAILAYHGLPLWEGDAEMEYKLRPGSVREWKSVMPPHRKDQTLIRVNRFRLHGDDFDEKKGPNERRILFVGDSVTMGYGFNYEDTFPHLVQRSYQSKYPDRAFRSMNAAIMGQWTRQQVGQVKQNLWLEPDLIVLGYCMNDSVDPVIYQNRHGGHWLNRFGLIHPTGNFFSWLLNDTGFGRAVALSYIGVAVQNRDERWGQFHYIIDRSADTPEKKQIMEEGWSAVEDGLRRMSELASSRNIPMVLIIFPYSYQVPSSGSSASQSHLLGLCKKYGIHCFDFFDVIKKRWDQEEGEAARRTALEELYSPGDVVHLSLKGHDFAAKELFRFLEINNLLGLDAAPDSGAAR